MDSFLWNNLEGICKLHSHLSFRKQGMILHKLHLLFNNLANIGSFHIYKLQILVYRDLHIYHFQVFADLCMMVSNLQDIE